jgi:SWI/SNF-related matrix-associated actin-dependent regulator of chromatin subfamily A-like protein 1
MNPASDPLRPYQHEGVSFLAQRSHALLGDDAGLGKSVQIIRAALERDYARMIVATPAIGRVSWKIQFETWAPHVPVRLYPDETAGLIPDGPIALIVTMDWLAQRDNARKMLAARHGAEPIQLGVVDEGHKLKTPSARRTRAIYGERLDFAGGIFDGVDAVWVASATFTPRHAGELYTHLRAVLPDVLRGLFHGRIPTLNQFEQAFCIVRHSNYGLRVEGNNPVAIPSLRRALKPHFLARRKGDVLKDLPDLTCELLPLEAPDAQVKEDAIQAYLDAIPPEKIQSDDDFLTILAAAHVDPHIARRRRALGLLKAKALGGWLLDWLENTPEDRKILVFAQHRDVIQTLYDRVRQEYGCVQIVGGMSPTESLAAITAYQTDPGTRVLVAQQQAAGEQITLTAGSDVVLAEPDWSPVTNYQAISRAHRFGQTRGVVARFAYLHGTIDAQIARILRRRAQDMADLFGAAPQGFANHA